MGETKPRVRVSAGRSVDTAPTARPANATRAVQRYLRPDSARILSMRQAVTRDAHLDVREAAGRASALALDFLHNSGWLAGAADQIIADTIGTELKLNARPDLTRLGYTEKQRAAWCRLVEAEWRRWAWTPSECDLAGKMTIADMLDAVIRHYLVYGEAFGVFDFLEPEDRRTYGVRTGTKVSLVAPHRLPRTSSEFEGIDQGIRHDSRGRVRAYRFRKRARGIENDTDILARDVIHVMDRSDNPGSPRGISVLAPILKVLAQSDQLADATLATALLQTIFAATIKSPEPSDQAFDAIRKLAEDDELDGLEGLGDLAQDLVDVWGARIGALKDKGISITSQSQINHLGPGEVFEMHTAATPGSQYLPFSKDLKREMARRLGVTVESFTGDHTGATYSSVRMGIASIWPIVLRRRERIAAPFAQAIYEFWLEESIAEGRIPFRGGYGAFLANRDRVVWAEWQGPAQPTADDAKSAMAARLRLELGLSSLADEAGLLGRDWEETAIQIGREIQLLTEHNIPLPFGRSTGGGGPNGMSAEGSREPRREEE
ncbi:phage portal protein [Aureimonas phyllosphaerae]|uniref:Lambda family phage portal protein n=1 Tax=Aureimonas phyllosphaerae TaxID=1166078 RepID=A0A7W6BTV2_9HYPH|nr:phage portal protein [Aureimonas phyllosphaerae]MBB3937924.1 lambda family phage portal protein [Aureimonas phyllosphaerae]MBB3961903.1 lambda family phage portal protein [Aureimonas phyllosphaerae]SFF54575.1 phage portal protein, lambda family [Aureimonas phyllosphaerae]